jgi:hypothetical protein
MKGLSANEIRQKLVATLGSKSVAYFILTVHLHAARGVRQNEGAPPEAELIGRDSVDAATMNALGANSLSSVHELLPLMRLSTSTLDRHSTQSLVCAVSDFCEDPQKVRNNEGRPQEIGSQSLGQRHF